MGAIAVLDLHQMPLDLTRELRRRESVDVDPLESVDQADALHRGAQGLAEPHRVSLDDQVLDDVGPGGGSAEPLLVEGGRQALVLDPLARVLHQGEQPRLGDAGGRLGLVGIDLDGGGPDLYPAGGVLSLAQGFFAVSVLVAVVVFQQELRRLFEQIASFGPFRRWPNRPGSYAICDPFPEGGLESFT